MLTIGLIDNYALMRMGMAIILHDHFDDVNILESNDITEFGQLFGRTRPDLIIMGINIGSRGECLELVSSLRKRLPAVPLIVYDDNLGQNLTAAYFELGISGYLLKQNSANEMIQCIDMVLQKKQYLSPVILESLLKFFAGLKSSLPKRISLTRRESEIARYLSQGMKTSWIASTLGRKPSTVSTIKNNIYKKLQVENIVELKKAFSLDFA
jgi:DNA-binding NarL/FixJ family response regulator